ncbi:LysR family transcriptional regulator [Enterobacteriaceae bacterium C34A]
MTEITIKQLKIINTLIECGSAVAAARQLALSPSAISYALNQLKKQNGLTLFTRTRQGLRPTQEALDLQKRYADLASLHSRKREFVITTYSLIEMVLAEYMAGQVGVTDGTLMHFMTMSTSDDERMRKLKHREVDIDIGGKLPEDRSIVASRYLHSATCIMGRADHPHIGAQFTLDDWRSHSHLRWQRDLSSINGIVEKLDTNLLAERDIAWTSPNLLTLAWLCSATDYVMLMPTVFQPALQKRFAVQFWSPPPELAMTFDCYLHYHRAMEENIKALALHKIILHAE